MINNEKDEMIYMLGLLLKHSLINEIEYKKAKELILINNK